MCGVPQLMVIVVTIMNVTIAPFIVHPSVMAIITIMLAAMFGTFVVAIIVHDTPGQESSNCDQ